MENKNIVEIFLHIENLLLQIENLSKEIYTKGMEVEASNIRFGIRSNSYDIKIKTKVILNFLDELEKMINYMEENEK